MSTSARTLQLLSLLQGRRYWPGAQLAERLEVSLRTLRRDVERLRELGYPVQAARGVDGGYQLAPGAVLPPLVLDDEEAVALAVALQAAAASPVAGTADSVVRALAKVVQVMPPRLRRRVDALRAVTVAVGWDGPTVDPDVLTTTAQACRDSSRLELGYTAGDGEQSVRRVEPHRLVTLGRRWYLVAHDVAAGDWRTFRVDRITSARSDGSPFLPRELPGDGDAAEFVRRRLRSLPTSYAVSALVHAPAEDVRARVGRWAAVEPAGPDTCRLTARMDGLDWAAFTLAVTAADLSEVEPPELVDHLSVWAARFARPTASRSARWASVQT